MGCNSPAFLLLSGKFSLEFVPHLSCLVWYTLYRNKEGYVKRRRSIDMPGPESNYDKIKEYYEKKIMQAKGNERIRMLFQCVFFATMVEKVPEYDGLTDIALDYFIPKKDGKFQPDLCRKRMGELSRFIDDEIMLPFNKFYEENPGHTSGWYKDNFSTNTPKGIYEMIYNRIVFSLDRQMYEYHRKLFGKKETDQFGRSLEGKKGYMALMYEQKKAMRSHRSPKELEELEKADERFSYAEGMVSNRDKLDAVGTDLSGEFEGWVDVERENRSEYLKRQQQKEKQVKTTDLHGEFDGWEDVDYESDKEYKARLKNNDKAYQEELVRRHPEADVNSEFFKKLEKKAEKNKVANFSEDSFMQYQAEFRYFKQLDFNFVQDDALKKSINEVYLDFESNVLHSDAVYKKHYEENQELFRTIDEFSQNLKDADHSYWINSGKYRDVKKNLQNLRKILVQGDVPANRQAIQDAYQKLSDSCYAYQIKNPGLRKDPVGNKRKEIIFGLSDFCDKQLQKYNPEKQQDEKIELEEEKQPVKKELVPFAKLSGSSQSKNYVKPVNKEMENNKVMGHQKGGK